MRDGVRLYERVKITTRMIEETRPARHNVTGNSRMTDAGISVTNLAPRIPRLKSGR